MDKKMKFKYFYGAEADQFSFYRIPKALFTDSYFKDLSRYSHKRINTIWQGPFRLQTVKSFLPERLMPPL